MNIVQLASMPASNPAFRAWVAHISVPPQAITRDEAAQFIRSVCKVGSRRDLATDAAAEKRFHQHVRRPFTVWQDGQQ